MNRLHRHTRIKTRRRALDDGANNLVEVRGEGREADGPVQVFATVEGLDLPRWLRTNRKQVARWLSTCGGALFRNFEVPPKERLLDLIDAVGARPMTYNFRSTPRHSVARDVYTATDYPANAPIPLHNEMSYTDQWPLRLAFLCQRPADSGGASHLADSRSVYRLIDADVRDYLARFGVTYVRNFHDGLDLPWSEVFGTDDRAAVEEYCRAHRIEYAWLEHQRLQTRQTRPASMRHPMTGEWVWFNQAHLFHSSALGTAAERSLIESLGEEALPRNVLLGNGEPIDRDALEHVRDVYRANRQEHDWQAGDVLMLDNVLLAHGRGVYSGDRQLYAVMADASCDSVSTQP